MNAYAVPAGPRSMIHASAYCSLFSGLVHTPCNGLCNRHTVDEYGWQQRCTTRCECACHVTYARLLMRVGHELAGIPLLTVAASTARVHLPSRTTARLDADGLHW